jgi:adenosylcobinamide kinase/adenosylcobinamide-phosphate guanylyltransferase
MIELILGGARSGKSRHASERAAASGLPITLVATAEALDDEMRERIAHHRAERPEGWRTLEVPLDLAGTIGAETHPDQCLVVDCLTLWLTNLMLAPGADDASVVAAGDALVAALSAARGHVLLVSNEVGLGLVPESELGRRFRDAQGRLNQAVARVADRVVFVAAGLPLVLKG